MIKIKQENIEQYLTERKEKEEVKGILLMGTIGVGKTYSLEKYLDKIGVSTIDIVRELSKKDLDTYNDQLLLIDDVGTESTVTTIYGAVSTPIVDLIDIRYRLFKNKVKVTKTRKILAPNPNKREDVYWNSTYTEFLPALTYFSTNLNLESLTEKYGERSISRLHEMCDFITLTGKDRRKNK